MVRKSRKTNHTEALNHLGELYRDGVKQDKVKAADKGDSYSQSELGFRYANGNGGAWNNLAVLKENGYPVGAICYNYRTFISVREMYEQVCQLGSQKGC